VLNPMSKRSKRKKRQRRKKKPESSLKIYPHSKEMLAAMHKVMVEQGLVRE